MSQEVAPRSNFSADLDAYEPQIAAALPAHINVDRFKRIVTTAINRNPDLYHKADRRSLFNACVQCASDGLVPDGREAALVIYGGKAQYLPMVGGVIKRMRNSGDVASVDAQVIHEHDHFEYALGDEAHIVHKPTLGDPGKVIGAYAIIKLTNGEVLREVMSVAQIEKVRAVSRSSKNGPWVQWFDEMARKTVLRRCAKRAPTSPDLERVLYRDVADDAAPAVAPARPIRQQFQAPETDEDLAAAGHSDLDAQYRETMAHDADGVIEDHSAPSGAPSPAHPPAEPQTPPQADGAAGVAWKQAAIETAGTEPPEPTPLEPTYDLAAEFDRLLAGAMAETTAVGMRDYWRINKVPLGQMKAAAPDLFDEFSAKFAARGKQLEGGA